MALEGLQNYTRPITLLGETTIDGTFNAKNVYVSGIITGTGISTNILGTDNTWEGTNDFQNDAFFTGPTPFVGDTDMLTKKDIDDSILAYNPLITENTWLLSPTFSNADPPVVPEQGANALPDTLCGYNDMVSATNATTVNITTNATNTFTGVNTFSTFVGVSPGSSLLLPPLPLNPASKAFVDSEIDIGGNMLTYVINTTGTFVLQNVDLSKIGKIDYWLFSGSCGGSSGAVMSGTIGNGNGLQGSIIVSIGTTADPAVSYTAQDATLPSSTTLYIQSNPVGTAFGACNLNGTVVSGIVGTTAFGSYTGLSANGKVGDNVLAYSNVLGTSTSAGGCIFIAYYL